MRPVIPFLSILGLISPVFAGDFAVVDGDTVDVAGSRYTLYGIDAPAPGEPCEVRGRMHDCGKIARAQLLDLTAGATVVCTIVDRNPGGVPVARCLANDYDVSRGMVYTGWATATGEAFAALEVQARSAQRGMWRTDAVQTEDQTSR